jgi:hypothetical protein
MSPDGPEIGKSVKIPSELLAQLAASQAAMPVSMAVDSPWVEGNHSVQGQTYGRRVCEALTQRSLKRIEVWGFSNLPDTAPAATRDWLAGYGVALTQDSRTETN